MKQRLIEVTRQDLLSKSRSETPERYARRMNYVNTIKPLGVTKDLFIKTGTLTVPIKVGDYIVTIHISKIMKLIREELDRSHKVLPDRPLVYRALRKAVDESNLYVDCTCPDFCLHPDAKILLTNKEIISIKSLKERFDIGEDLYVYGLNDDKKLIPVFVKDVWKSGVSKEFIKITFSNGKSIETTPDHLYLVDGEAYEEAQFLRESQKIYQVNINETTPYQIEKIEKLIYNTYIDVFDLEVQDTHNFYMDAGAILHNCYRFSYWASKKDYKYGDPETRPANITNPDNKGSICKHITAALVRPSQWLKYVSGWISTVVRAYLEQKLALDVEDINELDPTEVKQEIENIRDIDSDFIDTENIESNEVIEEE